MQSFDKTDQVQEVTQIFVSHHFLECFSVCLLTYFINGFSIFINLDYALAPVLQNLKITLEDPLLAESMKVPRYLRLNVMWSQGRIEEHHDHLKQGFQGVLVFDHIEMLIRTLHFLVRI